MLTPRNKRVKKETVVKTFTPDQATATQTKTVFRRDGVTPRKTVEKDYTNTYDEKGHLAKFSDITKIVKTKYDKKGEYTKQRVKEYIPKSEYNVATLRPNGDTPLSYSPVIKPR